MRPKPAGFKSLKAAGRVNFSAFGNSARWVCSSAGRRFAKGGLLLSGVALLAGAQKGWEGSFIASLFLELTQWFLGQVSARERSLSHLSHWDIFLHFQDYSHFHLDLCVLPPHTKKHLGTGLVGLKETHICPVQAIGIQSFTLSNATKREKRSRALALHFSTFKKGTVLWTGV